VINTLDLVAGYLLGIALMICIIMMARSFVRRHVSVPGLEVAEVGAITLVLAIVAAVVVLRMIIVPIVSHLSF